MVELLRYGLIASRVRSFKVVASGMLLRAYICHALPIVWRDGAGEVVGESMQHIWHSHVN